MDNTTINVRVDPALKKSADALFSDLGLNMSTAITIFLKKAVACEGLPFAVTRETPNAETLAALAEYAEMKKKNGSYKRYSSFDELLSEVTENA